jgi:universal stress protein A
MSTYSKIIVGIDLSPESEQVLEKAANLARLYQAELNLVHVIEPLSFAYGGDLPLDFSGLQEEIQNQAKDQLQRVSETWNIAKENQYLLVGRPEKEMHHIAETISADLIVVGSHGRHGLALILGSTSNGILHGANCDVLAVRVADPE